MSRSEHWNGHRLHAKTVECLMVASLPIGSEERVRLLFDAAQRYSWRAVEKKIVELVDRGYIEPLRGGTACGGLTHKGKEALESAIAAEAADPPVGSTF